MKRLLLVILSISIVSGFIYIGVSNIIHTGRVQKLRDIEIKTKDIQLEKLDIDLSKLHVELKQLQDSGSTDKQKILDLEKQIKDAEDREQQYKAQLQAKAQQKAAEEQKIAQARSITPIAYAAGGCNTGNSYKDYIYNHESSCSTTSVNSIGCRGLGQACPGSKLPCGADFACQDAYFSNYAIQRYGSWENAYAFWLANHWW